MRTERTKSAIGLTIADLTRSVRCTHSLTDGVDKVDRLMLRMLQALQHDSYDGTPYTEHTHSRVLCATV